MTDHTNPYTESLSGVPTANLVDCLIKAAGSEEAARHLICDLVGFVTFGSAELATTVLGGAGAVLLNATKRAAADAGVTAEVLLAAIENDEDLPPTAMSVPGVATTFDDGTIVFALWSNSKLSPRQFAAEFQRMTMAHTKPTFGDRTMPSGN